MKFCQVLCSSRQGWLCFGSENVLLFFSVSHQDDLYSPHFFKHFGHKYLCNTPKVHLFQTAPFFQTFLISYPYFSTHLWQSRLHLIFLRAAAFCSVLKLVPCQAFATTQPHFLVRLQFSPSVISVTIGESRLGKLKAKVYLAHGSRVSEVQQQGTNFSLGFVFVSPSGRTREKNHPFIRKTL